MESTGAAPSPAPADRRRHAIAILAAAGLILGLGWLLLVPPRLDVSSHSDPARDHAQAVRRIAALEAVDGPGVNPACHTLFMDHGHRTGRAVVLFHGLTNCPQQFVALGWALHAGGANVLIARLPHHGLSDRMTSDLARLDADELMRFGDRLADIGCGLGDSVTVAGLSLGAVVAAWLAQERGDVERALLIAPVLGVPQVWQPLTPGLTRFLLWFPNQFPWWDDQRRETLLGPTYVYPRFSTRALGETLRLGLAVVERAAHRAPRAHSVVFVTVGGDHAISNAAVRELERRWSRGSEARISSYQFPSALHLNHDLIDPLQPDQRVGETYPVLIDLLEGGQPRP
jgi:carboxylesterase